MGDITEGIVQFLLFIKFLEKTDFGTLSQIGHEGTSLYTVKKNPVLLKSI